MTIDDQIKDEKLQPNNLIYDFKFEGMIPKGFRNHQMPIELYKNWRVGNIKPIDG